MPNTEGADVLILSGDICVAYSLHDHPIDGTNPTDAIKPGFNQSAAYRYRAFFDHVSQEYKHVIITPGNHEFYHGRFPDAIDWLRQEYSRYPNFHFLYNDKVEIDDITFVGATLWTDFNRADPITLQLITGMMNDFRVIRNSQFNYRPFLPGDALQEHRKTLDYIKSVTDADTSKKYVVVGHHAPSPLSVHPVYRNETVMNGGYFSDLSNFILDRPQIILWTHGHMHHPQIHYLGDTLIACNPRGYANHDPEAVNFKLRIFDTDNLPEKFDGVRWGRE